MGVGIPQDYDEWKERILVMYEERQRDHAYNEAHSIGQRDQRNDKKPGNFKQITAPSKSNAGGATSSSGGNSGRDAQGRWHMVSQKMFGGQGEPMNVDAREQKCHDLFTFFLFTYLIVTPDRSDRLSTPALDIPMLSLQPRASSLRYRIILHTLPCNL